MRAILGALCLVAVLGVSSVANAIFMPDSSQCNNSGIGCLTIQQIDPGPASSAIHATNTGQGIGIRATLTGAGFTTTGTAIFGDAGSGAGAGVMGRCDGIGTGLRGYSASGRGLLAESINGDGIEASTSNSGRSAVFARNQNQFGGYGVYTMANGSGNALFATNPNAAGWAVYSDGKLYASSGFKPGGGSWTASSDARLKRDIKPLDGAVEKMLTLRGVTYAWIDPASQGNLVGRQTGFVAQDVEKVFPDWVGTDAKGFKTVTVRGFEALSVEAVRELNARLARLEQRPVIASTFPGGLNLAMAFGVACVLAYLVVQRRRQRKAR